MEIGTIVGREEVEWFGLGSFSFFFFFLVGLHLVGRRGKKCYPRLIRILLPSFRCTYTYPLRGVRGGGFFWRWEMMGNL